MSKDSFLKMSSHELVSSFEKLKKTAGEGSEESLAILPDGSNSSQAGSNSSQAVLKDFTYNDEDGPNFIDDADKAYIILLNVFPYLSIKHLLSAAAVCKIWNLVGCDNIFWKRISLKNCFVRDSDMMVRSLKKYGTEILDLRGMILLSSSDRFLKYQYYPSLEHNWSNLCQALTKVTTLTEITMEGCPPKAVTILAKDIPQLKSLSAYDIHFYGKSGMIDDDLNINFLKNMSGLKTLKLESSVLQKLIFKQSSSDTSDKIELSLTTLTITGAINLSCIEHILPTTLVSLELGNSHSLSKSFSKVVLPKLVKLARLRLEMCTEDDLATMLVENIAKLPNLSELELVNFVIPNGFQNMLAECTNLKSLLLIPFYNNNDEYLNALSNQEILNVVYMLKHSLQVFVWVLPDEAYQNTPRQKRIRNPSKLLNIVRDDSISILFVRGTSHEICFVSFDKIQSDFQSYLKFKILKTSFYSTWKLSLKNIKM